MTLQNRYTRRFGLIMIGPGDDLKMEDYRFTRGDRALLDQLLRQVIENHEHTAAPVVDPSIAPVLGIQPTLGTFPANRTLHYRVALVDDKGQESMASPIASVATPSPLSAPAAPAAVVALGGLGALPPGDYLYQVSAWTPSTAYETLPSPAVQRSLSSAGTVMLTMPAIPPGAAGWNVYRKGPYDWEPIFLASFANTQTTYLDNGTVTPNALRSAPVTNSTSSKTAITVDLAGGLPIGRTAKIYRTPDVSDWSRSLVTWTGVLPYTDTGAATNVGAPAVRSTAFGGAPKIVLTDAAEVQGTLPPGMIEGRELATWTVPGLVQPLASSWWWLNEFDRAAVLSVRATLGSGSVPVATPVIVQVGITRDGETVPGGAAFNHLVATATIAAGANSSGAVNPSASGADVQLAPGDGLGMQVTQAGGGATPTDYDLSVVVTLATGHGSTMTTYTWAS